MTREKDPRTGQRTRRTFMKAAGATTAALVGFTGVGAASGKDDKKHDGKKKKRKGKRKGKKKGHKKQNKKYKKNSDH